MTSTIVETRYHWRRGHLRRRARRRWARSCRRAARRPGVPGHRGWICPAAGLAGRVRDRLPGRHRSTGSYGAGLTRYVTAAGVRVVEVDRSDRQDRRRQGKSDPLDAVSAARAAQSGRARGAPKGRDGTVEAIRALMVAKRSARSERIQTINQARALILTGPGDLRARFAQHTVTALVAETASLRPRPGDVVGYATRIALRELGRRAEFLDSMWGAKSRPLHVTCGYRCGAAVGHDDQPCRCACCT